MLFMPIVKEINSFMNGYFTVTDLLLKTKDRYTFHH